jgi:hypothetical protein
MLPGIDWPDYEVKCKSKALKPPTKKAASPTTTLAGSLARLEVYAKRLKEGRPIFNPKDSEGNATRKQQREMKDFINQQEEQRIAKRRAERAAKKAAKEKGKNECELFDTGRKRGGKIVKPSQPGSKADGDHSNDREAASVQEPRIKSKDAIVRSC